MAQSSPMPRTTGDPGGITTALRRRSVMALSSRKSNPTTGMRTLEITQFAVRYCGRSRQMRLDSAVGKGVTDHGFYPDGRVAFFLLGPAPDSAQFSGESL